MKFNEIKTLILENKMFGSNSFIVKYNYGEKRKKRLFMSSNDLICEFLPRSQTKGNVIAINYIESMKPIGMKCSEITCCRNNLILVVKYLTESGLWKPMLNGAKYLQTLSDDVLLSMKDWDTYHKFAKENFTDEVQWFGSECFLNLFSKRIKTMNFMPYDIDYQKQRIKEIISNNENITYRWRNRYDNHYEIRFDKDYAKGWYSEKYKNCANGHYYFLLDECHVLFGEDD